MRWRSRASLRLRASGVYVLHAFLDPYDEELQLAGRAVEVTDPEERAGQPDTKAVRRRWRAEP